MKTKAQVVAQTLTPNVNTLLVTMTIAKIEREKCDGIQRQLLASGRYGGDGDPKTTYLLPDEAAGRYFADLDEAYRRAGYTNLDPGHCPALCAEYLQTQAEWALIKAAEDFFPGIDNNKLLCGTKELGGLETRQKYLDLLIGLVVNAPGYKKPM